MYEIMPLGRKVSRTGYYLPADIINALNAVEILVDTPEGLQTLDAVAAVFGLRRVSAGSSYSPVVIIEAPGREIGRLRGRVG